MVNSNIFKNGFDDLSLKYLCKCAIECKEGDFVLYESEFFKIKLKSSLLRY